MPSESLDRTYGKVSADSTERAVDGISERSESSPLPFVIGGLAIVGVGTGIVLYKKKMRCFYDF